MVQNLTISVTVPVTASIVQMTSVNGWMTIFSRMDSNFPLAQQSDAYIGGFGEITSNFWLGLKNIYYLTNSAVNGGFQYRLRLEMQSNDTNKWDQFTVVAMYLVQLWRQLIGITWIDNSQKFLVKRMLQIQRTSACKFQTSIRLQISLQGKFNISDVVLRRRQFGYHCLS